MFVWCAFLFFLGVLAFVDSIFNMGNIFRSVNSVCFMLISLGLLIRTSTKAKNRQVENLQKKIFTLEQEVNILKSGQEKLADY